MPDEAAELERIRRVAHAITRSGVQRYDGRLSSETPTAGARRSDAESGAPSDSERLTRALEDNTSALRRAELRRVMQDAVVLGRMRSAARDAAGGSGRPSSEGAAPPLRIRAPGPSIAEITKCIASLMQTASDGSVEFPKQRDVAHAMGYSAERTLRHRIKVLQTTWDALLTKAASGRPAPGPGVGDIRSSS